MISQLFQFDQHRQRTLKLAIKMAFIAIQNYQSIAPNALAERLGLDLCVMGGNGQLMFIPRFQVSLYEAQ